MARTFFSLHEDNSSKVVLKKHYFGKENEINKEEQTISIVFDWMFDFVKPRSTSKVSSNGLWSKTLSSFDNFTKIFVNFSKSFAVTGKDVEKKQITLYISKEKVIEFFEKLCKFVSDKEFDTDEEFETPITDETMGFIYNYFSDLAFEKYKQSVRDGLNEFIKQINSSKNNFEDLPIFKSFFSEELINNAI
jgi:hypothetical protein